MFRFPSLLTVSVSFCSFCFLLTPFTATKGCGVCFICVLSGVRCFFRLRRQCQSVSNVFFFVTAVSYCVRVSALLFSTPPRRKKNPGSRTRVAHVCDAGRLPFALQIYPFSSSLAFFCAFCSRIPPKPFCNSNSERFELLCGVW